MQRKFLFKLWPAAVALILAIGAIMLAPWETPLDRLTNLDLNESGFGSTYLTHAKTDVSRAFVTDRRDSSMRRSDNNQPGRKWDSFRFSGRSDTPAADTWLVKSKQKGKGTVFFIPVADVDDWIYPFLHAFIAARRNSLDLPALEWTNFYVNRIYQGLYLRVALPFDLRKKDGGNGILRELITIHNGNSGIVNTRFQDTPGIFADLISESKFPILASPSAELVWLAQQNSTQRVTVLLSNVEPLDVSLLPLPVSLPELFEALNGRRPNGYYDNRFASWNSWPPITGAPLSSSELVEMRAEFELYSASFRRAIRVDGEFHRTVNYLEAQLPLRQISGSELALDLGRF